MVLLFINFFTFCINGKTFMVRFCPKWTLGIVP